MVSGIKSGYNGEEAESGSIFGKLGSFLGKGYGKSKDSIKSTKEQIAYWKELQSGVEEGSLEFQTYQSSVKS